MYLCWKIFPVGKYKQQRYMNFINVLKFSQGTINNYCTRVNNSYKLYKKVKKKNKK